MPSPDDCAQAIEDAYREGWHDCFNATCGCVSWAGADADWDESDAKSAGIKIRKPT